MTSPLISVIIPVYNVEKHLRRCLDSLLAQTISSFEAILINDGSTDTSGSICDEYAGKDERFKVFHTANSGVSAARNLGLAHATAEYITFIDSDDSVEQNYLELMLAASVNDDLVIMGVKFTLPNGVIEKIESYTADHFKINKSLPFKAFDNSSYHFVYSKRYKRDILEKGAISFDTTLSMGEDTLFVLQYLKLCKKVIILGNTPYHYYRYGGGTLSSKRLDTYIRIDAANAKIAALLNEWQPGAATTPSMKRRFWLSFYYASFYILQDKNTNFTTKLQQLKETFSRTRSYLSLSDIWAMTHMEHPVFRLLLSLRFPICLLLAYNFLSYISTRSK